MGNSEKLEFLAESLAKVINKQIDQFAKSNKKLLKSIKNSMNPDVITDLMMASSTQSSKAMEEWEETSFAKLGNMTPIQYFDSMNSVDDIVKLISLFEEKNGGIVPSGLYDRISSLDDSFSDGLLSFLQSIKLVESKSFNSIQRAAFRIAHIVASPKFTDVLLSFISQLDNEESDDETFMLVTDVIEDIGEPALEPLINIVESTEKKGRLYEYLILTIGRIATDNKSERIYRLLKDYFRKSENKVHGADALAAYGDGRAIPAIRGYVERNLDNLSEWEYTQFRDAVIQLDGNMDDLDDYVDDYSDFDEFVDDDDDE